MAQAPSNTADTLHRLSWKVAFGSLTMAVLAFTVIPFLSEQRPFIRSSILLALMCGAVFLAASLVFLVSALKKPAQAPAPTAPTATTPRPVPRWAVPLATTALWLAVLAATIVHIFYLNPLATAPQWLSISQIYDRMRGVQEFSPVNVVSLGLVALLLQAGACALHFRFLKAPGYTLRRAIGWCALGSWASLFLVWLFWSFHMGMGLADTFATSGVDHARGSAAVLALLLGAVFLIGVYGSFSPAPRRPFTRSQPAPA